jgi:hypothetical protein
MILHYCRKLVTWNKIFFWLIFDQPGMKRAMDIFKKKHFVSFWLFWDPFLLIKNQIHSLVVWFVYKSVGLNIITCVDSIECWILIELIFVSPKILLYVMIIAENIAEQVNCFWTTHISFSRKSRKGSWTQIRKVSRTIAFST